MGRSHGEFVKYPRTPHLFGSGAIYRLAAPPGVSTAVPPRSAASTE